MNALATRWSEWSQKFAAMTRREKLIVSAAVVFGGSFVIFNFGTDPLLTKARLASKAEAAARDDIAQQQALITVMKNQNVDPDAANRKRLELAKKELGEVSGRLARFESSMVPPARMQAFLEGLLAKNRSIELLGLKTLPVTLVGTPVQATKAEPVGAPAAAPDAPKDKAAREAAASPAGEGIYQHGVEIRIAGSYNDLLNYLADLERMPQRLMWNSVSLTVEKHPRNIMVLRVYTLSLDKNWLVV